MPSILLPTIVFQYVVIKHIITFSWIFSSVISPAIDFASSFSIKRKQKLSSDGNLLWQPNWVNVF